MFVIDIEFTKANWISIEYFDPDGNQIYGRDSHWAESETGEATSGYSNMSLFQNTNVEKYKGKLHFNASKKGTYYFHFYRQIYYLDNGINGGDTTFKITAPGESSPKAELDYLSVTLEKGDTLKLGAVLTEDSDDKVTWKSSKTSVATVSSSGKVTAKKKGTATITAKLGDSTLKVKVTD